VITSVRTQTRLATISVSAIAKDMQQTVVTTALVIKITVGATVTVARKSGCDPSVQEPAGSARVLRRRRRTFIRLRSTLMKMEITRSLAVEIIRNVARALFPVELPRKAQHSTTTSTTTVLRKHETETQTQ